MDPEAVKEAKKVEELLGEIKANTSAKPARSFLNGLLYGAGIVLGTIVAVVVAGWILGIFGFIPGFDSFAHRLSDILQKRY